MKRVIALSIGLLAAFSSDILSVSSFEGVVLPITATFAFLYLLIISIDRRIASTYNDSGLPMMGSTLSGGLDGDCGGGDTGGGDGGC